MTLTLRPYQADAIDALERRVADGLIRPAIVMATGGGKTAVFSSYLNRPSTRQRGRGLVLAHREELVDQAAARIRRDAPHLRVGVVMAGTKQIGADVIVASVQTLRQSSVLARVRGIGTVVIDECHHATARSYRAILEHYGCVGAPGDRLWTPPRGAAVALGVTATMSRSDGAALGDIWQDIVYRRDIVDLVADGYLVRPRAIRVDVPELRLERVRKVGGDFGQGQLGEALEGSLAPEKTADAYMEHAGAKQGILFAPTVSATYAFAQALEEKGLRVGVIHGKLPRADRKARLEEFRLGKLQVLCNCMVLTEGTDLPMAEVVVIARPTKSRALFIQMAGRALRLDPNNPAKTEALILIVAGGGSDAHQLIAPVELFGAEPKPERGQVEIDETELDLDEVAEVELDESASAEVDTYHRGEVLFTEIDLFASSGSDWQRTYAGIWFTRAGESLVCVIPAVEPGAFDVLWMHHATQGRSGFIQRGVRDLRWAMSAADDHVAAFGKRGVTPTPLSQMSRAQLDRTAARLGLVTSDSAKLGELRARVSVALASTRIDPGLPGHIQRG